MLSDNDAQKFEMKGQTEMKHRILKSYLKPWLHKISKIEGRLLFVDGFAGPGRYPDGSEGSPLIAMKMADTVLGSLPDVKAVKCAFVEKNDDNFNILESEVERLRSEIDDRINPITYNGSFQSWADNFIAEYEEETPSPGLIFIDPFGYSGFPFKTLSQLYNLRDGGWELLITFMAGKMAQWMEDENHRKAITSTLGTDVWTDEIDSSLPKDERAELLSSIYQRQLKNEAGSRFTMPFEMKEETKSQICYYLIHVTNKFEGLKVMKETMFNAGADDQFAYLGPDHTGFEDEQVSFTEFGSTNDFKSRVEDFAWNLHDQYKGEKVRFESILRQTFDKNVFKLTHYRDAFEYLEDKNRLTVTHQSHLPNGNENRGYGRDDLIKFVNQESITDYS